jgi:hypothetical protein
MYRARQLKSTTTTTTIRSETRLQSISKKNNVTIPDFGLASIDLAIKSDEKTTGGHQRDYYYIVW